MPPKRKRAEDTASSETSSRATRASTRASTASASKSSGSGKASTTKATSKSKAAKNNAASDEEDEEPAPPPKKSKTKAATTKKTATTATKGAPKGVKKNDSLQATEVDGKSSQHSATSTVTKPPEPTAPMAPSKVSTESQPPPPKSPTKSKKVEPYSAGRALSLFAEYADVDDTSAIAAEGFERLCNDAEIATEGALPMILSWQMGCTEMLKIRKDEWVKATSQLKISALPQFKSLVTDLEDLLILGKTPVKKSTGTTKKNEEPYDRSVYWEYASDRDAGFRKLYTFCFSLAKPPQSRIMDMETSVAFWSILLVPKYPIMEEVLTFISEKDGVYKATNKDLWGMMLEFCTTVKPTLEDYEADGAWPTLLDDFVAWKKSS